MPVPHERDAVERHLLRDTAYTAMQEAIVSGTLQPEETLRDDELCQWLGVSRTPVRTALARLCDDGLVEMAPQRYTRVAPVTADDARETFAVLAAMHALATELAVPGLTGDDLARLRAENDRYVAGLRARDAAMAYTADERFHDVFVAGARNRELDRVLRRLRPRVRRFERMATGAVPGRRSVAQHEAILARARSRDAAGAASAARENWRTLGELVERLLDRGA